MRRAISILLISVSVLLLLIFAVFPHHHHGGMPCLTIKTCENTKACCNDQPPHNHSSCKDCKSGTCIIEDIQVVVRHDNQTQYTSLLHDECNIGHTHYFPIYFIVADLLNFDAEAALPPKDRDRRHCLYTSADIYLPQGLRAPPSELV